jgi:hypothetical protein
MLALSGLCEVFARGWPCLHTACPEQSRRAHLPVPKIPPAKPCLSITSKLIQIKRLQVLHFGHLRETGGRGSYRLVQGPRGMARGTDGIFPSIFSSCRTARKLSSAPGLGDDLKGRIDRIGRGGMIAETKIPEMHAAPPVFRRSKRHAIIKDTRARSRRSRC